MAECLRYHQNFCKAHFFAQKIGYELITYMFTEAYFFCEGQHFSGYNEGFEEITTNQVTRSLRTRKRKIMKRESVIELVVALIKDGG